MQQIEAGADGSVQGPCRGFLLRASSQLVFVWLVALKVSGTAGE